MVKNFENCWVGSIWYEGKENTRERSKDKTMVKKWKEEMSRGRKFKRGKEEGEDEQKRRRRGGEEK